MKVMTISSEYDRPGAETHRCQRHGSISPDLTQEAPVCLQGKSPNQNEGLQSLENGDNYQGGWIVLTS